MNSEAALGMFAGENLLEGGRHPLHQSSLLPQLALSPVLVVAQHQGQLGHALETVGLKQPIILSRKFSRDENCSEIAPSSVSIL